MEYSAKFGLPDIYFVMQGIGALLGWNAVLTGLDYFGDKYGDDNPDFTFSIAIFVANIIISTSMVYIQRNLSLNFRVVYCLMLMSIILIGLPIEAYFLANTTIGYIIIMGMLFFMGCFNTIQQTSIAGLGGIFPYQYMGRYVLGTGLAGLIINIFRIIVLLAFSTDSDSTQSDTIGIFVYFGVSVLVAFACMMIHLHFVKTEFCQFYLKYQGNLAASKQTLVSKDEYGNSIVPAESSIVSVEDSVSASIANSAVKSNNNSTNSFEKLFTVFQKIWYYSILMILVYIGTFMMFPGVMLKKNMTILDSTWEEVLLVTVYNSFDCIGKSLATFRNYYNKQLVGTVTLARFLLFITFILMAYNQYYIPVISDDWFAFINAALFALTNGFSTSALFILGPDSVEGDDKEIAGFVMAFSLQLGIVLGTFLALSFENIGD